MNEGATAVQTVLQTGSQREQPIEAKRHELVEQICEARKAAKGKAKRVALTIV